MTTRPLASSPSSTAGLITAFLLIVATQICSGAYYGKLIGKLSELHHGVSGEVYAVDARTLFIKDFTYDGEGPAAFFYAGNSKNPSGNGFRVRDERGTENVLKRYRKKGITLTLPDGKTLNNIKWFSVWCDEFSVNFGDVKIQRGFDYPKPQKLRALSGIHGVSSEPIVIVDAQTLLIPGFSYDGEAPDAKFWVGAGPTPSSQGIRVPDENGKEQPLRRYDRKTIVLTLPGDLTVHQLGHFGVWCEAFAVDFGHVQFPLNMNIPPSLKMLGVSPQSKLNCEVLEDTLAFEVRWAVAGDSIVVQLVAKLDAGQYMSFGISANPEKSVMIGGDVVVAWVDKQTLQGYAIDYFLDAKSQCSGRRGSCPDVRIQENTGSVRLLNAAMVNGYSIVTYQRPLKASDELDHPILTNGSQAIIWAIGPLNERQEVSFHHNAYLKTDRFIEFGRPPAWNCPMPDQEQSAPSYGDVDGTGSSYQQLSATTRRPQRTPATPAPAPTNDAWEIPPIQCNEPDDGVLYAQMGPTGGKHGYPAITGHVGWGISWYINGLLIPEINVVRGRKYTFVVEGGLDSDRPALYHPFYITDDPVGGFQHKTPEEKAKVKIFAGVRRQRGMVRPTGVGRLCNWVPDQNQPPADDFASFGAYQRTLTLECDHGEPGIVEWTPDENTPDTVYYQCFSHRYLGWKINVHDTCNLGGGSAAASEKHEVYVLPQSPEESSKWDLEHSGSTAVASKVTPTTADFLHQVQHVDHPHRAHGHPHRYAHHSATNPASKLSASHNSQLLTNNEANNNYDRLQSPSSESAYDDDAANMIIPPHRSYETHTKDAHHPVDVEASKQQQQQQPQQQTLQQQQQQQRSTATIHEQSPFHTDYKRPLNNGVKLLPYVTAGAQQQQQRQQLQQPQQQLFYIRTPHHYANNYPHYVRPQLPPPRYHRPPEPRTQLMIIRRPVIMRRPMLQTVQTTGVIPASGLPLPLSLTLPMPMPMPLSLSLPTRPVFIERKKSVVYRPPPTIVVGPSPKATIDGKVTASKKLGKVGGTRQRVKLEAKMSEAAPVGVSEKLMGPATSLKPARNTGFDPDSVVIEGGFKPIIRNAVDDDVEDADDGGDVARRRIADTRRQGEVFEKGSDYRTIDDFSPVFVPSLSATSASPLNGGRHRETSAARLSSSPSSAPPLDDPDDDMEMAADRSGAYYLPPLTSARSEESSSPSSDVLISYDGRRLKDSSGLARSISDIERRSRVRLNSAVLSRTPQFGRFQGELPPPIPDEVYANRSSAYDRKYSLPTTDLPTLGPVVVPRAKTRLTVVERSKRSPLQESRTMSSVDFQRNDRTRGVTIGNFERHRIRERIVGAMNSGETRLCSLGYVVLIAIAARLAI